MEVFDNDSIHRILRVRRRDCVPSVELRRCLCFASIPSLLVQGRLRWFSHAARRPKGELIKGLEPISGPRVFGHARWRKDRVNVSSEVAQDRRTWSASVRNLVNVVRDAGSTRPG